MTAKEIIQRRLLNQQIATTEFTKPQQVVGHLVAMQAQVWEMAKWAIGLRLPGSTNEDVEAAFNNGSILRTHLMRPTWHFVTPDDIRWLLALTAPRVNAFNTPYYRKMQLDEKIFRSTNKIFIKILNDGKQLDRSEIKRELERNKISTNELRFTLLLMQAELAGLICSGPRKGKQFTYTLLDERVPAAKSFYKEEALAELVKRYFITRGPATISDFVWWSGLMVKDAKQGLAENKSFFEYEKLNGVEYFFKPVAIERKKSYQSTLLLPDYDEYGISYKNRELLFNPGKTIEGGGAHALIIDGVCGGAWKKEKDKIILTHTGKLNKQQEGKIRQAIKRYYQFFKTNS